MARPHRRLEPALSKRFVPGDVAGLDEVPLHGGRLTDGVVRVGDTVRRPATPSSKLVARLLLHLEARGFGGAPRYLGRDERSRSVLTYIAGTVPKKFQQFSDHQIRGVGLLLREFHDATLGFEGGPGLVVCHHDAGPNNVVFDGETPIAFIDFDMAAGADPLEDLGYVAWTWCVSSKSTRAPVVVQAAQVRLLMDSYGATMVQRHGVFASILDRQSRNMLFWTTKLEGLDAPMTFRDEILERVNWSANERAFAEVHHRVFAAALR